MNFNIIDGNQDWLTLLPQFTRLYNNHEIPVTQIKKQLNIGKNTYNKLWKESKENGLITPRRKPNKKRTYRTHPKYYSPTTTRGITYFRVAKHINGKYTYFCQFKKKEQAELMVEKLKKVNWNQSQTEQLKSEVLSECP
jgi:hypothetical protein